jgi:sugar O-acyltransferase (sialic acid O-acetyltransferase NeuD family)
LSIDVLLVGVGGFAREALDVFEAQRHDPSNSSWRLVGAVDDHPNNANLERLADRGHRHLGPIDAFAEMRPPQHYILGIGDPATRARIVGILDSRGWVPLTLVHPRATIGSQSTIGCGAIICAGAQISTNVRVGRHVHLNPGAIVGHDAQLGDFVSANPGSIVSGDVEVGNRALIGAGAVILQGLSVGEDAIVGASACVTRDVAPGDIVKGVPAR